MAARPPCGCPASHAKEQPHFFTSAFDEDVVSHYHYCEKRNAVYWNVCDVCVPAAPHEEDVEYLHPEEWEIQCQALEWSGHWEYMLPAIPSREQAFMSALRKVLPPRRPATGSRP